MHRKLIIPSVLILSIFLAGCQLQLPQIPFSLTQSTKTWSRSGDRFTTTIHYESPGGQETNTITITISRGIIQAVEMSVETKIDASIRYQQKFSQQISGLLVGQQLSGLKPLDKVSGASLTTDAFNQALLALQKEQS